MIHAEDLGDTSGRFRTTDATLPLLRRGKFFAGGFHCRKFHVASVHSSVQRAHAVMSAVEREGGSPDHSVGRFISFLKWSSLSELTA